MRFLTHFARNAQAERASRLPVGTVVAVRTKFDTFEGAVYCVDAKSRMIALETNRQGRKSTSLVSFTAIVDLTVKGKAAPAASSPAADAKLAVTRADIKAADEREARAIAQRREEAAKIGVGVTAEAQAVFDAMSKMLECRWKGKTIVLMDNITISPPYDESACKGGRNADQLMAAKKMLSKARSRIAATNATN